jgi:DHA2 family multidrug resistance protein
VSGYAPNAVETIFDLTEILFNLPARSTDGEVAHALDRPTNRVAEHSAAAETTLARATTIPGSIVRREANVLSTIEGFQVAFWAAIIGLVLISLMRAAPAGRLMPAEEK